MTSILALLFGISTALAAPQAPTAQGTALPQKKLPAKKLPAKKTAKKAPVAENGQKLPTKLPKFTGKKKMVVTFGDNSIERPTTVVVRTPLPLEKALEDEVEAKNEIAKKTTQVTVITEPRPVTPPTATTTPAPTPSQIAQFNARATPAPTPSPTPMKIEAASAQNAKSELFVGPPLPNAPEVFVGPPTPRVVLAEDAPVMRTKAEASVESERSQYRAYVRASYLDANYSKIKSDLKNGASHLSAGLGKEYGKFEARLSFEIGHGLDQEVTLANTRNFLVRLDGTYFLFTPGDDTTLNPFAGVGLGYMSSHVRSFRNDGGEIVIREHLNSSAGVLVPTLGVRTQFASRYSIDLAAEYFTLLGGNSSLGGLAGVLSFGVSF